MTSARSMPNTRRSARPAALRQIPASRPTIAAGLLATGLALLVGRLFTVQVLQHQDLSRRATAQQRITLQPFTPRRPIVDASGNLLAVDEETFTVYVHPAMFSKPLEQVAADFAPILGRTPADLLATFRQQETGIRLANDLTRDTASRIEALHLDGVDLASEPSRIYPQGDLYSSLVGFLNADREAQAGLEFSQRVLLERQPLRTSIGRTGGGSVLPDGLPPGFLHQDDLRLQLTINGRLQLAVRDALARQLAKYHAKRGTALVMDVRDGSLLSVVSLPTYDANHYWKSNPKLFTEWSIHDLYEPGSTFKPINIAIALEEKKIAPTDIVPDEGRITVGGWPINNHDFTTRGGRGALSIAQVLQYSSNVGMVHIMQRLPAVRYYEWLTRLGIDQAVGTDLPFTAAGQLKRREDFVTQVIEPATAAFGQGLSLTPLKLLQLHAAIANGGQLVVPHVVAGLVNTRGELYWQPPRPAAKRLFSPETSHTVTELMETVVQSGSGKIARIPGYRIAGKTGTAQKAENGIYISGARITSFIATLPVENPRYAVLVVVDEPKGDDAYGSTVAAPVAKRMIESLISFEALAPNSAAAATRNQNKP